MWLWGREDVDSGLRSILKGEMFAPRDQTVKMAVGAQIGFLQRSAQESVAQKVRGVVVWASCQERETGYTYGIASGELNAGKRSEESGGVVVGE
jgi:hypothetical protein